MRPDWLSTTIGAQVTLQRGFDITKAEQRQGSVAVVSSSGIASWHDTAPVKGPGVILGRKGVVGSVFYLKHDYWPHDTTLWVKDFKGNDPRFVYYFFRSIRHVLAGLDHGTANPTLNRNHVHPVRVQWPRIDEQRPIAALLGRLDDKIDLNRRTNQTLESMTRAIFRSWLVDFDPVVAKADGRQPFGMDADTAALFPSGFVESELGPIPRDWQETGLDQIADFLNGLALQNYRPSGDESLPVIKIAQLRAGNVEGAERASPDIPNEYVIDDGDVLFSWSGSLLTDVWCGGRGALNQHLFKVTSSEYPKWFFLYWIEEHLQEFQAIAADKATTMGHIRRHHLSEARVVVPSKPCIDAANRLLAPLLDLRIQNRLESRTLAALRDALLPKLLSGQIGLRQAEKAVEAAL